MSNIVFDPNFRKVFSEANVMNAGEYFNKLQKEGVIRDHTDYLKGDYYIKYLKGIAKDRGVDISGGDQSVVSLFTTLGNDNVNKREKYLQRKTTSALHSGSQVANPKQAAAKFRQTLLGNSSAGTTLLGA